MSRMKRKDALNHIRYAGYHRDGASFVEIYVSNRVSYEAANAAYNEGVKLRANGMTCGCRECSEVTK